MKSEADVLSQIRGLQTLKASLVAQDERGSSTHESMTTIRHTEAEISALDWVLDGTVTADVDGLRWSTNLDDAFTDFRNYGGFLLKEGQRYVVVADGDSSVGLRLRTPEQYEALESRECSEVPLPEGF